MTARAHHLTIRALDLTPNAYVALEQFARTSRPPRHGRTVTRLARRGRSARIAREAAVVTIGAFGVGAMLVVAGAPIWAACLFAVLAFTPVFVAYRRATRELPFERPERNELLAA